MNSDAKPPSSVMRGGRRRFRACLILLGLVLVFLAAAFQARQYAANRERSRAAARHFRQQLLALNAEGIPTTPQQLDRFYASSVEPDEVSTMVMSAIRELDPANSYPLTWELPIVGASQEPIPPPGQPWEQHEAARQLLDLVHAPLEKLHAAADRSGQVRFPLSFEEGYHSVFGHRQQLRNAARFLSFQAHVLAREGDPEGAVRSVQTLLALARTLEQEPLLAAQLLKHGFIRVAARSVEHLVSHVALTDAQLEMMQRELRCLNVAKGLQHGLVGERVFALQAMKDTRKLLFPRSSKPPPPEASHEAMSLYLEVFEDISAAMERPWPEARNRSRQVAMEFEAAIQRKAKDPSDYAVASDLVSRVAVYPVAGSRADAEVRIIDTAIAVQRWRLAHGQPPPSVEALVPDYLPVVPRDPFTGKPLRYVVSGERIMISSLGREEEDHTRKFAELTLRIAP